ncbi:MAG: hypothetical protein K6T75_06105 [Acetobacteraceae bacterium]|nr:hypothetical protein [Acetobacteraceae bacterium]
MKRVVSVSLGSSRRDHRVEADIAGERFCIERVGTDGDIRKAVALIRELDGKVDCFGMGGTDLYVVAGRRRYVLRAALPMARAAQITPIVDGSGLKNTLERRVVRYLAREYGLPLRGKTAFIVCAMDRFGLAETLVEEGCRIVLGDFMFVLGVPIPLYSLRALDLVARVIAPIACRLPMEVLYPTGKKQEEGAKPKWGKYYLGADIVAGDFHYIRRHLPAELPGKTILTNTVTREDVDELRRRGVALLITTTPELEGRSFGTNVMEGVLVALSGKRPDQLTPQEYDALLDSIGFRPRVQRLA